MNVAWALFWGGSRSVKPCVFPCDAPAAGDEKYVACHARRVRIRSFWCFFCRSVAVVYKLLWICLRVRNFKSVGRYVGVCFSVFSTSFCLFLPNLTIKCKLHHKLLVIMWRHGANHSSHMYTMKTICFFSNLLMHLECIRSRMPNLRARWQDQSNMHLTVITHIAIP